MTTIKFGKTKLKVKNLPSNFTIDEDDGSYVDLTSMSLNFGRNNKELMTFTLTTDTGLFAAIGNGRVSVAGSGTDTISFTGKAKDIGRYFDTFETLSFSADPNASTAGMAKFGFSATFDGETKSLPTSDADITDAYTPVLPNEINGTSGDDTLIGSSGVDEIDGLAGNDTLQGLEGDDTIIGGSGNDVIRGGAGADTLSGGSGEDTLQYRGSDAGILIDLNEDGSAAVTAAGGHAEGDTISGFENVYASEFDDVLIGDRDDNVLFGYGGDDTMSGGRGDDVLRGGKGADTMTGGSGDDWLRYLGSDAGVTVDLNLDANGFHQTSGGDAQGDIASGFENIYGSDFADVLTGDAGENHIYGYDGNDIISGGAGNDTIRGGAGADTLSGGDGTDNLEYRDATVGVTVDLSLAGIAQTSAGEASGDILSGFENVYGSDFGDTITGDAGRNFLYGLDGDDTLNGGDGADYLRGGTGADTMDGGAGKDVLNYGGSTAGVTVNLVADALGFQSASGGDAQGDVISNFENVYATNFDDVLTGDDARNILYAYGGNDTLDGGEGNDVLRGGAGDDTFVFTTTLDAGNIDRITDFSVNADSIGLDSNIFAGLVAGALDAAAFAVNATGIADTADQRVIYDSSTGGVFFDADGSGGADGLQFATLGTGLSIDEADFFIF